MTEDELKRIEDKLSALRLPASREFHARIANSMRSAGVKEDSQMDSQTHAASTAPAGAGRKTARPAVNLALKWLSIPLAASVLLAAALFFFAGHTQQSTALAALAEAVENSGTAEWVHTRTEWMGKTYESWMSFKPHRRATRQNGCITYFDGPARKRYVYDEASGTIAVDAYRPDEDMVAQMASFAHLLTTVIEKVRKLGATVTQTFETVDGTGFDVFTVGPDRDSARFYVDPVSKRVMRAVNAPRFFTEVEVTDPAGSQPLTLLDYSDSGPRDIYEVGAPRGALVVEGAVDAVESLRDKVEAARAAFAPSYYAIVLHLSNNHLGEGGAAEFAPEWMLAVYKKNGKYRMERYATVLPGEKPTDALVQQRFPPDHMGALESWTKTGPLLDIMIWEGTSPATQFFFDKGRVTVAPSQPVGWRSFGVEMLTWQSPMPMTHLDTRGRPAPVPSRQGDLGALAGAAATYQGQVHKSPKGDFVVHPIMHTYYFDPARDFAAESYERLSDTDAPWQTDKEWLSSVSAADRPRFNRMNVIRRVLEYAQTPQGQWYAKKVQESEEIGPNRWDYLFIIHLDTLRPIPDEVFDVDKLKASLAVTE